MNEHDLAIEWVTRGLTEGSGHQLHNSYDLATRLEPDRATELRLAQHQRLPTASR